MRWILSTLSPSPRAGQESAPAFLFDMNVLFERAVANTLRRRLAETNPDLTLETQTTGAHLANVNGKCVDALRPDIIIRRGSTVQWIADTKWKRIERSRAGHALPSRSDMFQVHAYALAYGADRLVLIYPDDGRRYASTLFELPLGAHSRPTVQVLFVDVQRDELPLTSANHFW